MHPVSASDAIRLRAPTIAPARANLPITTSVLAYLPDIVPHSLHVVPPARLLGGGFGGWCPKSMTEEGSRGSDWNPQRGPC
ncbi:hypothetical protein GCM10010429_09200 [Micromonospora olivasterospora]